MAMFSLPFCPASSAVVSAVKKKREDFYKVFGAPIYTIKQGALQYPRRLLPLAVPYCRLATSPVLRDPVVRKNHIEVRGRHLYFNRKLRGTFGFVYRWGVSEYDIPSIEISKW